MLAACLLTFVPSGFLSDEPHACCPSCPPTPPTCLALPQLLQPPRHFPANAEASGAEPWLLWQKRGVDSVWGGDCWGYMSKGLLGGIVGGCTLMVVEEGTELGGRLLREGGQDVQRQGM